MMPNFSLFRRGAWGRAAAAVVGAAVFAGMTVAPAAAQAPVAVDPTPPKDPTNAALLYYQVFLRSDFVEMKDPIQEKLNASDPAWKPDAELSRLLEGNQEVIEQLLRATRAPNADFGVEFSQGVMALLPHLGMMRTGARILAADARRLMEAGEMDAAGERIAGIYRMANHLSGDRVLISSLVSVAVAGLGNSQVEVLMQRNRLTRTAKESILQAMRTLSRPDAFGIRTGLEAERFWATRWMREHCRGKGERAGAFLVGQVLPLLGVNLENVDGPKVEELTMALAQSDEKALVEAFDQVERAFVDLLKAWDSPDAFSEIEVMKRRIQHMEYGILAYHIVPALGSTYKAHTKSQADHAATLQKLEFFIPIRN